jgi:putative membrane protein
VLSSLPYCGSPPGPGALLHRFNWDPVLLASLLVLCAGHWWTLRRDPLRHYALAGWLVAAAALVSPLCALSVALFSARVGQHMILILIAAPLIALALPSRLPRQSSIALGVGGLVFFLALWIWHMPIPYETTFTSVSVYWAMHVTLFGSAVWLWRELLHHPPQRAVAALTVGTLSFAHMGLLGAVLAFATRPLFQWHVATTYLWNLTPLQDQQLGGVLMWVPGVALSLWIAIRSVNRVWVSFDKPRRA